MEREETIRRWAHLVPLTRQRLLPAVPLRLDAGDLEGAGYVGLIRAVDRFEAGRGMTLKSYAVREIRYAMLEYLREEDWVPRSVRDRIKRGEDVGLIELVSLDEVISEEPEQEHRLEELVASCEEPVESQVISSIERRLLHTLVDYLPRRERHLLVSYYWHGSTLKELALSMNRSETRVLQWHEAAIHRLRTWLTRSGAIYGR